MQTRPPYFANQRRGRFGLQQRTVSRTRSSGSSLWEHRHYRKLRRRAGDAAHRGRDLRPPRRGLLLPRYIADCRDIRCIGNPVDGGIFGHIQGTTIGEGGHSLKLRRAPDRHGGIPFKGVIASSITMASITASSAVALNGVLPVSPLAVMVTVPVLGTAK